MSVPLFFLAPELCQFGLVLLLFWASAAGTRFPFPLRRCLFPAAGLVFLVCLASLNAQGTLFHGSYTLDPLSQFFKAAAAGGFCFVAANALDRKSERPDEQNDYFFFLALSAWGLMILASCVELITLFLALELSSYSLYAVIPLRGQDKGSAEAAAKYILFGAAATAFSLFGLSQILAAHGSSYIAQLSQVDWSFSTHPQAAIGLALFLCGMFYKLALFPFHFWCPDVYQGASNETAAFVATLPKLGAVLILIRLAACLQPGLEITHILALLAFVSMTAGNLCALAQNDLKRLLGFSSVAHAGYIIVGLIPGTAQGFAAAAFYALAYMLMNLLCFWVICRIAADGQNLSLQDLNGLSRRSPLLAFSLAVGAFALLGIPPSIGFMGKLFLITAAWGHGYNWLIIALVLNSAIAVYYYLSLVRHAYTEDSSAAPKDKRPWTASAGALGLAAACLLFGILPEPIFNFALRAANCLRGGF